MGILLKEIDGGNWREAVGLRVLPEQEHFVASNVYSLAEAYVRPRGNEHHPFAIYDGALMVGFAVYECDPASRDTHWISRLMIDHRFQGRGHGRAALAELLKLIRRNGRCEQINLCVNPANAAAQNLYRSFGFADAGRDEDGDFVFTLYLK